MIREYAGEVAGWRAHHIIIGYELHDYQAGEFIRKGAGRRRQVGVFRNAAYHASGIGGKSPIQPLVLPICKNIPSEPLTGRPRSVKLYNENKIVTL